MLAENVIEAISIKTKTTKIQSQLLTELPPILNDLCEIIATVVK